MNTFLHAFLSDLAGLFEPALLSALYSLYTFDKVIVCGVSASGKTTVAKHIAPVLGFTYYEGDDFHSEANIAKMSRGQPLDDSDRQPWLDALRQLLHDNPRIVLSCSALKRKYRDYLYQPGLVFVLLTASLGTLQRRASKRQHFMPPSLLESQFAALEVPPGDEWCIRLVNTDHLDKEQVVETVLKLLSDLRAPAI